MGRWHQQLKRIERWCDRLHELMCTDDSVFNRPAESYADDFHAFFVECYHMKDWLNKDSKIKGGFGKSELQIEQFINETPCLSFCADLCNLKKHLVLEKMVKGRMTPSRRHDGATVEGLGLEFYVLGPLDDPIDEDDQPPCGGTVDATQADRTRQKWLDCDVAPHEIKIQIFSDPLADGEWACGGAFKLAREAVNAWRSFVGIDKLPPIS